MRSQVASLAAFIGAALWGAKALAILATGWQPPLAFELGPVFFALSCVALAGGSLPRAIGALALFAAALSAVAFVLGRDALGGPLLGVAMLAVLASLAVHGWSVRRRERAPFVVAAATLPLMALGGALSLLHERLLELPLLGIALLWAWLGLRAWRAPRA